MKKKLNKSTWTYIVVILVWAVVMILQQAGVLSSHLQGLLVPATYYAIVAVGLNICVGILGELSLGHAGFMCVGAFSSSLFSIAMQDKLPVGIRFPLALIIGIPVLRLNGDYLAIVTLAFGEIIKNILNALYLGVDSHGLHASFTSQMALGMDADGTMLINGPMGISGTPRDANFTVAIVILLIALFVAQNLVNSRDGRAIMSIRDNRIAAESVGINITHYKMLGFVVSAAIAGAAGVLFSHSISTLQAGSQYFGYNVSILILVYVVLGGIGNISGSVLAAAVLYLLPELLRALSSYRMLIYSIVLIAVMLFNWAPAARNWRAKVAASLKKTFGRKERA